MKINLALNQKWWGYLASRFISLVDGVPFSHCAIEYETQIFESEWPQGQIVEKPKWLEKYEVVKSFDLPIKSDLQSIEMAKWLNSEYKRPYSITQLFAIFIGTFSVKLRRRMFGSKINGSGSLICTEFVGEFLQKFYSYDFKKPNDFIDLKDILIALESLT